MLMKDKQSGETVGMRYGPAMAALDAGTHEVVNETPKPGDEPEKVPEGGSAPDEPVSDDMTKAELEAEADRRGVDVPAGATKAEIIDLVNGA